MRTLKQLAQWYSHYEEEKIAYANYILRKLGGKPEKDDPILYENLLSSTIFSAFIDRYKVVVRNLIESGRLRAALDISYIPNVTLKADTSYVVSALTKDFGVDWSLIYKPEIKDAVKSMFDMARAKVAEDKDTEESLATEKDEGVVNQITTLVALYMSMNVANHIITPAIEDTYELMISNGLSVDEAMGLMEYTLSDVIPMVAAADYAGIATVNINLARSAGRVLSYRAAGVSKLRWVVVPDEVLCSRCEAMDGQEFTVSNLEGLIDNILGATNHNEFVAAHPFPAWNREEGAYVMPDGTTISPDAGEDALIGAGLGLCPLHGSCYSKNTEVYTKRGWIFFKDLNGNDEYLSLVPETKELEWVKAKGFITRYEENINIIQNKQKSLYMEVTEDHPMFGYNRKDKYDRTKVYPRFYKSIKELSSEFRFYLTSEYSGKEETSININGIVFNTDDFLRFLGYYLSEGSTTQRYSGFYQISIAQEKYLDKMYNDILKLGNMKPRLGKDKIYIFNRTLGEYLIQFGKSPEKFVPEWVKGLSPRQIRIFLDAFCLGDGSLVTQDTKFKGINFSPTRTYCTSSKRLADDIGELLIRCGRSCSYILKECAGKEQTFSNGTYVINNNVWVIDELSSKFRMYNKARVTKVLYNDLVYDVELEKNNTLLTRCNGKVVWGSNCRCSLEEV